MLKIDILEDKTFKYVNQFMYNLTGLSPKIKKILNFTVQGNELFQSASSVAVADWKKLIYFLLF